MQKVEYIISLKDLFSATLSSANKGVDTFENKLAQADKKTNLLTGSVGRLGTAIAGAFAVTKLFQFGNDVLDTTAKFEGLSNVINFTANDAKEASDNQEYLTDLITRMKLPLEATTQGFADLSASMMGSKLHGQGVRDIFEGVATATTAMHLSAQNTSSIFLALQQMMSKGKVQAQEMTLQLGQALPGSLKLMADALKMSTADFAKAMEKGLIKSEDALPKFAKHLQETFSGAVPNALNSLQARMTEASNSMTMMKLKLGEELRPMFILVLKAVSAFGNGIREVVHWCNEHRDGLVAVAFALGTLVGGIIAYNGVAFVMNAYSSVMATIQGVRMVSALTGATTWQLLLNSAMSASPVGLVITALSALVGWVTYLWNTSEKARGIIWGTWEVIKEILSTIISVTKDFFTGNIGGLINDVAGFGERVGKAFADGQKKGLESWKASHQQGETKQNLIDYTSRTTNNLTGPGGKSDKSLGSGVGEVSGTKQTTLNIHIDKLVENFKVSTTNLQEAPEKVRELMAKTLLTVVNDTNQIAHD